MVKRKFVTATLSDVSVGLLKPTMAKIVAEKYMREFYLISKSPAMKITNCYSQTRTAVAAPAEGTQLLELCDVSLRL